MNIPEDRKYHGKKFWIKGKENSLEIGITEPAAREAERFVFLNFTTKEGEIKEGELFGEYEALKRIGELESPVTGDIKAINSDLESQPEKIVEEPYTNWLIRITPLNKEVYDSFMNAEEARELCKEEKQ